MINLYFNAEKQILTRTDREDLASSSREIHKCNFNLSNDWDDMQVTAVFKYMSRKWDVLLADNACTVPAEVLEGQEGFTVGLYGTNGDQVITSTLITVPVSKGANAGGGGNAQVTPSMFDQIMAKIEEIEEGQIDPESIEAAIDEYLRENPDAIINPTEVYNAITRSRLINLIPKYTDYRDGLEKTDATPGVNYYVLAPGHMGNQEDRFEYGPIVITVMAPGASRASYYYLLKRAGYLPAGKYKLKNAWQTNDPNISIIYGYTAEGAEHVLAEATTSNEIAEFEITQEIIDAGYDQILYIKLSEGAVGGEYFPLLTYGDVTDFANVPEGYVDNNEELTKATFSLKADTDDLKDRVTELEEHGTGTTPVISAAATVDNTTGTPAVNVTKTGTDAAPEFTFAFTGLKGAKGDNGTIPNTVYQSKYPVLTSSNMGTTFSRLADINENSVYIATYNGTTYPNDFPVNGAFQLSSSNYHLITTSIHGSWKIQTVLALYSVNNIIPMATRAFYHDNVQIDWAFNTPNNLNTRNVLTVGNGNNYDYASLTEAIIAASGATNTDVYVSDGTYDIYAEFIEKYGENYFKADNFTSQPNYEGLPLNNGVNVYFTSGAKVVCELPINETSETAQSRFAAFKLDGTDAGLYNLDLYCKNTRYSIHDEASGRGSYHHVYKDCRIEQARDQNSYGYENCIGGGCGLHGRIDIENCYFKGAVANGYSLTWHNGSQSGAQSYIFISNSYFEQGKIRFRYYGVSDLISRMTVSGCSIPYDIDEPTPETGTSTVVNTEIVKWNNAIRTND